MEGAAVDEEVSTVFVGGIPSDATPRELDNLCRFLPGFVNSKVDLKKGKTLFVRFDTPSSAFNAISALHGQVFDRLNPGEPLRVVLARSNMKSDKPSTWIEYPETQPPPPAYPPVYSGQNGPAFGTFPAGAPAAKRPRVQEDPSEVDTVASVGASEKGIDEESLRTFFSTLPGFVTFKPNPRMGGGFAKFESAACAFKAIELALEQSIPAEIAKSSMGSHIAQSTLQAFQPPMYQPTTPQQPPLWRGPGTSIGVKRQRESDELEDVDTVASVGAAEKGISEASLRAIFATMPGFLAFKPNPRMGGGFAKFESAMMAVDAAANARAQGVPAEMARSSMVTTGVVDQQPAPVVTFYAKQQTDPAREVDTVACVGAAERGFDEAMLRGFFSERPGFVTFKANPRMGGGFAKFETPHLAVEAIAAAQERGIPADMARTSMQAAT
mmetsp:Transcript_105891/g.210482  ORF Transcript_105891/g.210482 Transcript_105891/m.210482 type:complete len:440 (-) Transcript_105891:92-1411(-)